MEAKDLVCAMLSALMEIAPDTELAKLTAEFAQRSDADDSKAFWVESNLMDRIKQAIGELEEFEKQHPNKLKSQASDLAKSL